MAGRYTLDREIGRGGMGAVWLGRDEVLGRAVAMKKIGGMPGAGSPDLERAEREAKLAARLNHPHVVAVYDLVNEGDEQWLVMEYVEGVNLSELVRRDGPLSVDQAATVIRQAAEALSQAHAAGIVHRDVKPSNIMVTPAGQVKLTDFGIARAEADASLTQTGLVTGSPAYLAPEVATGSAATDASDVWSLGATLYHALEGSPPYDVGDNVLAAMYRIVNEEPPRPSNPGWLGPLLLTTMAKEPADRWSMEHVQQFVSSGPRAGIPTPPPLAADHSTQAMPAATGMAPVPPVSPVAPERRRPRRSLLIPVLVVAGVVALALIIGALVLNGTGDDTTTADEPTDNSSEVTQSESESASPSASESPSASASPTASESAPDASERTAAMTSFVRDYLTAVVSDPKVSWQQLTPEFQDDSGGFGQYNSFWKDFASAEVTDIGSDPKDLTVDYEVEYTLDDGGGFTDVVQLQLKENGDSFLIAGEPS